MHTKKSITEKVFLARIIGAGIGLVIGIVTFLHFGARTQTRMNADSLYSLAPMYGPLKIPGIPQNSTEVKTAAVSAGASSSIGATRRGILQNFMKKNPRAKQTQTRRR